jgi:TadE-like protein
MRRRASRAFISQSAIRNPHLRRGLAPLEFVLTLPILVMMMALMIDFGVVGAWKIRTQTNARYAGWRTLTARTGEFNATPPYWPASANLSAQSGTALSDVSQQWDSAQDLLCPCTRGQQLTAPNAVAAINVPGRLEMDDDVIRGHADLERNLPLFRGALPATGGRFHFNINQDLFDNHWQYNTLGIPYNDYPRSRVWWDIEHSDLAALDGVIDSSKQLLDQNLQLLQTNPSRADLYPLDNDEEFLRYTGNTPEFYPRLGRLCMSDPNVLYLSAVSRTDLDGHPNPNSLLSRIDRLPCTMSGSFTGMYRSWICGLERCDAPDGDIDPLRQRYGDLQQFMGTLGAVGCSRPANLQRCICPPMTTCPCPPSPVGVGR